MIILEGADNTGKTTLANKIAQELDTKVIHSIKPIDIADGINRMSFMKQNPYNIYDRVSCISEMVYGPILRGKSIYGEDSVKILINFFQSKPLIIMCGGNKKAALTFNNRKDMEGVQENAVELYASYEKIFNIISELSYITPIRYDYTLGESHKKSVIQVCKGYHESLKLQK